MSWWNPIDAAQSAYNNTFGAIGEKIAGGLIKPDGTRNKLGGKLYALPFGIPAVIAWNKYADSSNRSLNEQRTGGTAAAPAVAPQRPAAPAAPPAPTAPAPTQNSILPPNWQQMTLQQQQAWLANSLIPSTGTQVELATKLWQEEAARTKAANEQFLKEAAARLGVGREDPNMRAAFNTAIGDLRAREAAAIPSIQMAFDAAVQQANMAAADSSAAGRDLGSRLLSTYNTAAGAIDNSNALTNTNFDALTGGTAAGVTYADANDMASLLRAQAPSAQAYAEGLGSVLANSRTADAQTAQMQSAAEQAAARNLATRLVAEQTAAYQEREAARQQQIANELNQLRQQAFRDEQDLARRLSETTLQIRQDGLTEGQKFANEFSQALIADEIKRGRQGTTGASGLPADVEAAITGYSGADIPYGIKDGKPTAFADGNKVLAAISAATLQAQATALAGADERAVRSTFNTQLSNAIIDQFGEEYDLVYGPIVRQLGIDFRQR
jgi:hypothetical protein